MRECTLVLLNDWMETPARVNIKQPWQQVTSVILYGLRLVFAVISKRSTVVGWSPATHLIVGVLRYVRVSSFGSIRSGTAMVRVRRSLHTMLMTNSNFEPVSTGCLLLTVFMQLHLTHNYHHHHTNFHMLIHTSQSQRKVLTKIKGKQQSKKDSTPKRRIYKV